MGGAAWHRRRQKLAGSYASNPTHRVFCLLQRVGDGALRGVEVVRQQAADQVAVAVVADDQVGLAAQLRSRYGVTKVSAELLESA